MMPRWVARRRPSGDSGYVAVLTALLIVPMLILLGFAVDVGNWYYTAQQEQRAADAAALAGVPNLPGDPTSAFAVAQDYTKRNGYPNGGAGSVVISPSIDGQATRLKVTVKKTVNNFFGQLVGLPTTTISRTAVADYSGPIPLGSPCNEFGNDPLAGTFRSNNCNGTGQFWANVGSPGANKSYGDAYQDNTCSFEDACVANVNNDYDTNGYFYTVTVPRTVNNLTFEVFDPALIAVGDLCDKNGLAGAAGTRFAPGASSPYCTGDIRYGGTGDVTTQFTVRQQVSTSNPWDPTSYPPVSGCTSSFAGRNVNLSNPAGDPYLNSVFRKWVGLCTIASAAPGTYMIQVKTNGLGTDAASGHNRFGLRAYSTSDSTAKDVISLAGYGKMAMYANLPNANTVFYLARIPSGAAGQFLNVRLFDVGDSTNPGTITVKAPAGSGVTFTNCVGTGVANGNLPSCSITADSSYNGKWQTISVPIPKAYTCNDAVSTDCWVTLQYLYGSGNQPSDTTSWTATLEGNPVRLVR